MDVEVCLDKGLDLRIVKTLPHGSTVADLKGLLAREDPTGAAQPQSIAFASQRRPSEPLRDSEPLTEALAELVLCSAELEIRACGAVSGEALQPVRLLASDCVRDLRLALKRQGAGGTGGELRVLFGQSVLEDAQSLAGAGLTDGVEVFFLQLPWKRVLTASADRSVRVWHVERGTSTVELSGHNHGVCCASFSPDGSLVITASEDCTARIWSLEGGACLHTLAGHVDTVNSAAFSPDGSGVITASADHTARIWSATSGECLYTMVDERGEICSAQFTPKFAPECAHIVTASFCTTVSVWLVQPHGCTVLRKFVGHTGPASSAAFSPDGEHLLSSSFDCTARVWRFQTGSCLSTLAGHKDAVTLAAFSPDGALVVTTCIDRTAKLWAWRTGSCLQTLQGHRGEVCSAAFSVDGEAVVTGSEDKTAKIWSVETGRCLHTLTGHKGWVHSVAVSPV